MGKSQDSLDKQFVRDYLEKIKWNKQPPVPVLPQDIIEKTNTYEYEYKHDYENDDESESDIPIITVDGNHIKIIKFNLLIFISILF